MDQQVEPATVFAIDDDERFLTAVGRVLRHGGYAVDACASPADFLHRTPSRALGCLLVDLQMPAMTGLEFQQRARAAAWTQPIVFLTGHGTVPTTAQAFKDGALDVLVKPVRAGDLLKAVGEAVRRHQAMLDSDAELAALRAMFATLTPRERAVCLGVARGQLNKQIAYDLEVTLATIKFHRARGLIKLGVQSVPELVLLLDRIGVLPRPLGPVTER